MTGEDSGIGKAETTEITFYLSPLDSSGRWSTTLGRYKVAAGGIYRPQEETFALQGNPLQGNCYRVGISRC